MGGSGSGRHGRRGGRPRTEECGRISVTDVLRNAPDGMDPISQGHVTITYGPPERVLKILIATTQQPRGGVRAWFRCPSCDRRCSVLYLPRRHHVLYRLACRQCHGLCYRSQMVSITDRWHLQAQKLYAKAGTTWAESGGTKPKGMRWRTYHSLIERAGDYANARMSYSLAFSPLRRYLGLPPNTVHNARQLARLARNPRNYRDPTEAS